jgi:hypothetical protein
MRKPRAVVVVPEVDAVGVVEAVDERPELVFGHNGEQVGRGTP